MDENPDSTVYYLYVLDKVNRPLAAFSVCFIICKMKTLQDQLTL